jgi:hypothetical protein
MIQNFKETIAEIVVAIEAIGAATEVIVAIAEAREAIVAVIGAIVASVAVIEMIAVVIAAATGERSGKMAAAADEMAAARRESRPVTLAGHRPARSSRAAKTANARSS